MNRSLEEDLTVIGVVSDDPEITASIWYEWGYEEARAGVDLVHHKSKVRDFRSSYSYQLGVKDSLGDLSNGQ